MAMTVLPGHRLPSVLAFGVAALIGVAGAGTVATIPAAASTPRPSPGSPGLGDRLYPTLGNGGYDVRNYDLSLAYPQKDPKQTVTGDVTITAVATQSLSRFDLDFGGGSVARVAVNGRPAAFSRSGDELVITPKRPLAEHRRFHRHAGRAGRGRAGRLRDHARRHRPGRPARLVAPAVPEQ
jgi:hypothetical protein